MNSSKTKTTKPSAPDINKLFRDQYKFVPTDPKFQDAFNIDRGLNVMDRLMHMYPELTINQAAGIAANAGVESYFNPSVRQGQLPNATGRVVGGGAGLFQWDGARRNELMRRYPGQQWMDLENQLEFFKNENASTEKSAWRKVLQTQQPEEAAKLFVDLWERAGTKKYDEREKLAQLLAERGHQLAKQYAQQKQNAQAAKPTTLWENIMKTVTGLFD